jgi:hypothetical protein
MSETSMTTSETSATSHMPPMINWLLDNVLLTLIMICEGYIIGFTLTSGWVPNIEDPNSWGFLRGAGVFLFFLGGLAAGGLTVRISFKAAEAFQRHHVWKDLVTCLG